MRRYYMVSGMLLILPIIDFAIAAPALVRERREAGVDVVHMPGDPITMLGKRGGEELEKLMEGMFFKAWEKPIESSSSTPSVPAIEFTNLGEPLPSIPEEPSPVSSPDHAPLSPGSLTESGYEPMEVDASPGPSSPGSSTMSSADHDLMGAHAPPGPLSPALSTMSSADHESMGTHALPNPGPSTESIGENLQALTLD